MFIIPNMFPLKSCFQQTDTILRKPHSFTYFFYFDSSVMQRLKENREKEPFSSDIMFMFS